MNEIRDLIIGIDFGEKTSQICYYDRKAGEPRSVSMKIGSEEFEAPTMSKESSDKSCEPLFDCGIVVFSCK